MSIWKYQYFVDVIDLKSFTKAGKKNFVSQTAISQQISQLEKSIGGKLVNRGNGEVTPTQLGKLVYRRAAEMIRLDEQMLREIEEMKDAAVLRVGIDSSVNKSFWGMIQSILDDHYKEEDFRFSRLDYTAGSMMLDKNDLDIYVGYGLHTRSRGLNIGEILLCRNRLGVFTGDNWLRGEEKSIDFEDLRGHPVYASAAYPCSTQILDSACMPGFAREVKMTGNLETLALKVEMNNGYTFADSRYFSFCTGRMYLVNGLMEMCSLRLYYRTDCAEKEGLLRDFMEKVKEVQRL